MKQYLPLVLIPAIALIALPFISASTWLTLTVAGLANDLGEGLQRAKESIDSGKAAGVLARWVDSSNSA